MPRPQPPITFKHKGGIEKFKLCIFWVGFTGLVERKYSVSLLIRLLHFWNALVPTLYVEVYPVQHRLYSGDHLDNECEVSDVRCALMLTDLL